MKASRFSTLVCAVSFGLATGALGFGSRDAVADGVKDKKLETDAPTTKAPISISPAELTWGIDKKKLASIYDKVIDGDYAERYKKAQPGPDMEALDAEVQGKKDAFRKSNIDFDKAPASADATPLTGEYTYGNKESLMRITRAGKTRDFFFIQQKLWKVVDELPLGESAPWGKDFQDALVKIAAAYGVSGRVRNADPASGRPFTEADWKDATTQVRAVDWKNGTFAIIFQDAATVKQLATLRTAKQPQAKR